MSSAVVAAAVTIVVWAAYLRLGAVLYGSLRAVADRRRFRSFRVGWVEALVYPEPVVLVLVAWLGAAPAPATPATSVAALVGAALVLAGWDMILWTWRSWPRIFTGHGVLTGQRLIEDGAYGFVRHPVYLGALLIWLGVAIGLRSPLAAALLVLYVWPAYRLYIRAEEEMMREAFGEEYAAYCRRVPGLLPRWRRRAAVARRVRPA